MKKILIIPFLLFAFSACQKVENSTDNTLSKIDITNAKTLFITQSTYGSTLYGIKDVKNSMQKVAIDDNNELIYKIKYYNSAGDTIVKDNPIHVFNLTNFIILCFGDDHNYIDDAYIVNKNDGKVFQFPSHAMPGIEDNSFHNFSFRITKGKIQEDSYNNMYFESGALYKASLTTPSNLQLEQVSAVNDIVYGFCIDNEGNIVYSMTYSDIPSKLRYRHVDGSFSNILVDIPFKILLIWKGTDGEIYSITTDHHNAEYLNIIENGNLITKKKANIRFAGFGNQYGLYGRTFHVQGKIIFSQSDYIIDISNANSYKEMPCSVQANITFNDQLFYFDQSSLSCTLININDGKTFLYYDLDESKLSGYDIDKIVSVDAGGITFSAVDLRNGKYVIAKINLDNSVSIQQSTEGIISLLTEL